jgi:uncharacterized protein YjbI with pentapeptide repeats
MTARIPNHNNCYFNNVRKQSVILLSAVATIMLGSLLFPSLQSHFANAQVTEKDVSDIKQLLQTIKCNSAIRPGVNLTRCDLANIFLENANLSSARLDNANLTGADLAGADLSIARLANANLAGADLTDVDLTNATLAKAILTNANLTGALTDGADFTGAIKTGCMGCPT